MTRHVHWLLDIEDSSYDAITTSPMASQRLRAGCMMRFAREHGVIVTAGRDVPANIDTLIIGKIGVNNLSTLGHELLTEILALKSRGKKIILDYTDNHIKSREDLSKFYKSLILHIDEAVCSSETLRDSLGKVFSGNIRIIIDPIEVDEQPPKMKSSWPRTLLWFGHNSNLNYLVNFLPRLNANVPIRLLILSDLSGLKALEQSKISIPSNLLIELRPWSLCAMYKSASESDLCIIPSNPLDPRKSGVSSNRLLTALMLGLPTLASNIASYAPFKEYYADIDDPNSAAVIVDPTSHASKVRNAQKIIAEQYSMKEVSQEWFHLD